MRIARLVGVVGAVLVITATGVSPALAADGHIVQANNQGNTVQILFSGAGLPAGAAIDPASVRVTFNGQQVPADAVPADRAATPLSRAAMLVIDTSGSMNGAGIAGAKGAASAFLDSVPADVQVGLVTFSARPVLVTAPTKNHDEVRRQIGRLTAQGETALYDAAALADRELNGYASRTLLLLTDGGDTRSRTSLAAVVAQVKNSKTVVDAVGFRTTESQSGPLNALSTTSGGRIVTSAGASGLADAFRQAALDISSQVLVTVTVPQPVAGQSGTITVTASAGTDTLTDAAYVTLPAAVPTKPSAVGPQPVQVATDGLHSRTTLLTALVLLFIAISVLTFFAIGSVRRGEGERKVRRRLSIYTLTGRVREKTQEKTVFGESSVARSAVELAGRAIAKRDFESALTRQLEASAVPLKPAEWLLIQTGVMLGTALFLFLLTGGKLVPTLLGLALGIALPLGFLKVKENRRRNAFLANLPDTLQLIAGSLSAGYSLPQAVDTVVTEGTEPIAGEFKRALIETRLGVPIEDALEGIAERLRSRDFAWVVMAIRIQRDVGGNLAEVLKTTADTLRERERLRRQVQVLSAEGRLSAWILGGLPVVFALYLITVRPNYIKVLVTDRIGIVMTVGAIVSMIIGTFWLRKVVKVEV